LVTELPDLVALDPLAAEITNRRVLIARAYVAKLREQFEDGRLGDVRHTCRGADAVALDKGSDYCRSLGRAQLVHVLSMRDRSRIVKSLDGSSEKRGVQAYSKEVPSSRNGRMAENGVEYRFVLKGRYTPETIPQARLAEYLAALADLYGDGANVYFAGLAESSLIVKSRLDLQSEDEVADRMEAANTESGPADVRRAYDTIRKLAVQDHAASAWIERQGAPVLQFPTGERQEESAVFGPFWQRGHLSGTVILLGGKSDPVSVKIQTKGKTVTCKAKRDVARDLRDYIWGQPIRVEGNARWIRDEDGAWKLLQFDISTFDPLDEEPLTTTVARLRAIEGRWKDRADPLAELDAIKDGEDGGR
jgi:hypothetical protein